MKRNPYLVCVTGLKNSGKTTVCTAIIAELISRGFAVAALKSSHVAELNLDDRAGDSYALVESGARFVLVQGSEQSLTLERRRRSFAQMLATVPEGVDFVISEGGDAQAAASVVVCLSAVSAWEETLRVRRIPENRILAVAGCLGHPAGAETFKGHPLIEISSAEDRQALVGWILSKAGRD